MRKIGSVTLLVRDYDEAMAFFTKCLRFKLLAAGRPVAAEETVPSMNIR